MRKRVWARFLGTVLIMSASLSVVVGGVNPLPAVATCGSTNQHDGVLTGSSTNTIGVNANISHYFPRDPCEYPAAWVMVDRAAACNSCSFGQIGFNRGEFGANSTVHYFAQYALSSGALQPVEVGVMTSPKDTVVTEKYSVWLQNGVLLFTINDVGKYSYTNPDWTADENQYMAEVHNTDDQVPGDTTDHLRVNTLQRLWSGSWLDVNAKNNKFNTTTHGTGDWADDPHFHVWDERYSNQP
jgi:hypothetical protein